MKTCQENFIIILHGWGSGAKKWKKVKENLIKQGLKVIIPDLFGFAKKPGPKNAWLVDDYVEWLKNFSEKENVPKFFLLGHSFGGRIAIKFASKYPEKIKGLILVCSAGIKPKKSFLLSILIPILKKFSFLPGYQFLRKNFYRYILRKTDYLEAKGVMKETFKKIIKEDLTPYLSQIKVPTLILGGKKDKITPLKDAYLMKEKIKDSKLEILEKVGHSPHLEEPEKLSKVIIQFLKS